MKYSRKFYDTQVRMTKQFGDFQNLIFKTKITHNINDLPVSYILLGKEKLSKVKCGTYERNKKTSVSVPCQMRIFRTLNIL